MAVNGILNKKDCTLVVETEALKLIASKIEGNKITVFADKMHMAVLEGSVYALEDFEIVNPGFASPCGVMQNQTALRELLLRKGIRPTQMKWIRRWKSSKNSTLTVAVRD